MIKYNHSFFTQIKDTQSYTINPVLNGHLKKTKMSDRLRQGFMHINSYMLTYSISAFQINLLLGVMQFDYDFIVLISLKTYAAISNAHLSRVCKREKLSGSCLSTLNGSGSTQLPILLCHIGVPTFSSQNN